VTRILVFVQIRVDLSPRDTVLFCARFIPFSKLNADCNGIEAFAVFGNGVLHADFPLFGESVDFFVRVRLSLIKRALADSVTMTVEPPQVIFLSYG